MAERDPTGDRGPVDRPPVPLDVQAACVAREVALRRSVYPERVGARTMSAEEARHEVAAMEAVGRTLEALRAAEPLALAVLAALGYDVVAAEAGGEPEPVGGSPVPRPLGFEGEAFYAGPPPVQTGQGGDGAPAEWPSRAPRRPAPPPAPLFDAASADVGARTAFEARAEAVGLTGDGYAALMAEAGAQRHADLDGPTLGALTAALTPEAAADHNEAGFVRRAVATVRRAPERRRADAHAKALARAAERFDGAALARVTAALDRAAGLPIPPPDA